MYMSSMHAIRGFGCCIVVLAHAAISITHGQASVGSDNSSPFSSQKELAIIAPNRPFMAPVLEPVLIYAALSENTTNSIANTLRAGVSECSALPTEYRADCTSQTYYGCSAKANSRDYSTAKREIKGAAKKLASLVSQNVDGEAELLVRGNKVYRAVKKSAVKKVNQKALKIIAETETKLLRSAGSGERKVHYQRIAQAVNSTKKIFRS